MNKIDTEIKEYAYVTPYHWFYEDFYESLYLYPLKVIKNLINSKKNILDFGCGDGKLTYELAKLVKESKVLGVDIQPIALEFANLITSSHKVSNIYFQELSNSSLVDTFKENSFDLITMFDVIEHIPDDDLDNLLQDAYKILDKNGLLVITTPNIKSLTKTIYKTPPSTKHYHEYTPLELGNKISSTISMNILQCEGYYLRWFCLPKIFDHYSRVFPIRELYKSSIPLGKHFSSLAEKMILVAQKR